MYFKKIDWRLIFSLCLLFSAFQTMAQGPVLHAHNDYEHERPLWDALGEGFQSVEADIHLHEGRLLVAHDKPSKPFLDFEEAYLIPLWEILRENDGLVYSDGEHPFFLLIDIKTEAEATGKALQELLSKYMAMIRPGNKAGGVWPIISGNRSPALLSENPLWASYDGRPSDLGQGHDPLRMPWVSENYVKVIGSLNRGIPTGEEQAKISALADKVHAEGKQLRLWFTPESEEVWAILLQCGVDILNTDELQKMRDFINRR